MSKFRSIRTNRGRVGTTTPVRPQRATGLTGSTVGVLLDSSQRNTTLLNTYVSTAHVVIGLMVMASAMEDVVYGGPTRPALIPIAGAYMSSAVVFYTTMKEKRPVVLAWILGLSEVVLLTGLFSLTVVDLWGGAEVTFGLLAAGVLILYSTHGIPRLTATIGASATLVFVAVAPVTDYVVKGQFQLVQLTDIYALLLLTTAAIVTTRMASAVRFRRTRSMINRLQQVDFTVSMHRTAGSTGNN